MARPAPRRRLHGRPRRSSAARSRPTQRRLPSPPLQRSDQPAGRTGRPSTALWYQRRPSGAGGLPPPRREALGPRTTQSPICLSDHRRPTAITHRHPFTTVSFRRGGHLAVAASYPEPTLYYPSVLRLSASIYPIVSPMLFQSRVTVLRPHRKLIVSTGPRPPFSSHVPSYRYGGFTTAGRRACQKNPKSTCKVRRSHIRMKIEIKETGMQSQPVTHTNELTDVCHPSNIKNHFTG